MIRFRNRLLPVGVACLVAVVLFLVWPSKPPRSVTELPIAGKLRVEGITVVDPRDGHLESNMTVEMAGGRITRVSAAGDPSADPSIQRVDGRDKFIVPGFNNMHEHAIDMDDPSGVLALMLAEGVTGFRQMSGSDQLLEERREHRLPLTRDAPELLAMPGAVLTPFNAGSPEAATAEVLNQKAAGADFIKIGLVSPDVFRAVLHTATSVGLPALGHLQVGVDPAQASHEGFRSIEHLGPGNPMWIACSSERDSLFADDASHPALKAPPFKIPFLETVFSWWLQKVLVNPAAFSDADNTARLQRAFDSYDGQRCRALAELFRTDNTWHVPTLVRLRTQELADDTAYLTDQYLRYMPQANIDRWREVTDRFRGLPASTLATLHSGYARNLALAKLLSDAGVPMMAGTDGGGLAVPGMTLQQEFDELARAGISPLKVLQMTTINPAIFLGRTRSLGLVADGYDANLVLLDANPLESVANLHRIAGVIRAGFYYSAADLKSLRDRVARGRGVL